MRVKSYRNNQQDATVQ